MSNVRMGASGRSVEWPIGVITLGAANLSR
jgi:hypothetical protein